MKRHNPSGKIRSTLCQMMICVLLSVGISTPSLIAQESTEIDSLLTVLSNARSTHDRIPVLLELSNVYSGMEPIKSRQYAEQILLNEGDCSNEQLTLAYRNLGQSYHDENQFDLAADGFNRALLESKKLEDKTYELRIAASLSTCYRSMGNINRAFEVAFDALKLADDIEDYQQAGSLHNRIGELYREQNETDKAIRHLMEAYNHFSKANRERGMLSARVNLALAYKQRDAEKALETYESVLVEFNHLFTPWDSARIYSNLANINLDLRRYVETESYLMQALDCHARINKPISLAYCYKELGELYLRTNRPKKVVQFASQALQLANRFGHITLQYQSSKQLSDAYAALGQYRNAYRYLEDFTRFQDSSRHIEKIQLSNELEAQYATAQKEQTIQFQEEQLARQEAEMNKEQVLRNALIGGVVLLVILGLLIYRNAQLQAKKKNELKQFADKVQELQSTQSRWFTNIAHELRTPLTLILGPIRNLSKQSGIPKSAQNEVSLAKKYGDQLVDRVNEILEISRLESGKLVLDQHPTDMVGLLKQVSASFESLASERDIKLEFQHEMESMVMLLDAHKITTILNNLVSNAIKFTPSGKAVRLELDSQSEESDMIRINVADSGIGIAKEDLPQIFDRFYQVSSGADRKHYGGSGVGLTLSQELAKLHDGLISVDSSIDKGSTFTLSLPTALLSNEVPLVSQKGEIVTDQTIHNSDVSGLLNNLNPSILLVEDHPDMRTYIRSLLEPCYEVTEAGDGHQAMEILEDFDPDLIISDVKMPGMDGLTFAKKIKANEKYRFTPFINLTAHANEKDKLIALKSGVDDYLIKPFDTEELIARVHNLISNSLERKKAMEEFTDQESDHDLSYDDKVMDELEDLIQNHMPESTFSVPELAELAAMSTSTLSRHVKKMTGLTPGQLIRDIRLRKAIQLLESQQLATVSEVVYAVGFEDVSSFSRLFKKRFGKSPSSYLKTYA